MDTLHRKTFSLLCKFVNKSFRAYWCIQFLFHQFKKAGGWCYVQISQIIYISCILGFFCPFSLLFFCLPFCPFVLLSLCPFAPLYFFYFYVFVLLSYFLYLSFCPFILKYFCPICSFVHLSLFPFFLLTVFPFILFFPFSLYSFGFLSHLVCTIYCAQRIVNN